MDADKIVKAISDIAEKLAASYTEDQLRGAIELAKERRAAIKAQNFKDNSRFLVCACGERATHVSRPESVQYRTTLLHWDDENLRLNEGSSELESQPGDDDYKNPSIDDFIAFAWCGSDECEWFSLGTERSIFRHLENLGY